MSSAEADAFEDLVDAALAKLRAEEALLEGALANPKLPSEERAVLEALLADTRLTIKYHTESRQRAARRDEVLDRLRNE